MAAKKYLEITTAGILSEVTATVSSAGAADDGKIVALDSSGRIDSTVLPTGVGVESAAIVSSESMTAPCLVNVWNDGGTPKARYADASAASGSKKSVGFLLSSVTAPAAATVLFEGTITGLSALTPGSTYFLSGTTPGGLTTTAPTTSAHSVQEVGVAISTTALSFEPSSVVVRA